MLAFNNGLSFSGVWLKFKCQCGLNWITTTSDALDGPNIYKSTDKFNHTAYRMTCPHCPDTWVNGMVIAEDNKE